MNRSPVFIRHTSVCTCSSPESLAKLNGGWLAIIILLSCVASDGRASILTFDQIRQGGVVVPTVSGNNLEDDYGDRITGSPMDVSGGQFTYGNGGEGFTPNVVADFVAGNGTTLSLWQVGYGDLTNVAFGNNISLSLNVQLTADPGFVVDLYHFDLAGWNQADYTINAVRVLSGSDTLFSQDNVLVQGADDGGDMHTAFDFAVPLSAEQLVIQIDHGNLAAGMQDNIGIDNIRFGQDPPAAIPIPPALWLFGSALLGLIGIARRKKVSQEFQKRPLRGSFVWP